MSQVVTPLDPDSEHGKAIAARLSRTLAVIERELFEGSKTPAATRLRAEQTAKAS